MAKKRRKRIGCCKVTGGIFMGVANGRKRKCLIKSLVDGDRLIEEKEDLKKYITDLYKGLFGSERDPRIKLGEDFWRFEGRVEALDNQALIKPFSMEELEKCCQGDEG